MFPLAWTLLFRNNIHMKQIIGKDFIRIAKLLAKKVLYFHSSSFPGPRLQSHLIIQESQIPSIFTAFYFSTFNGQRNIISLFGFAVIQSNSRGLSFLFLCSISHKPDK